MRSIILTPAMALLPVLALACGADYAPQEDVSPQDPELGSSFEAVAACEGDDLQYDFNAFAASLAVAMANELGRWDAVTDFEIRNGKLELSATGELHCSGGCNNIRALLRLQDDAASSVPYHSPSVYRSKLSGWYNRQKTELTTLVDKMLTLNKGTFRFKNRQTGKYLQVDGGSLYDNAFIEQRSTPSQPSADQWKVVLDHTAHKLINVRSGKCMALAQDRVDNNISLVQQTCYSNALQQFGFATIGDVGYTIRTKQGQALRPRDGSGADDVPVVQYLFNGTDAAQQWSLEPVGSGTISPDVVATAMYNIVLKHSNRSLAVDNGAMTDNALIEQKDYVSTDDRFHWYVVRVGTKMYNFVNRKSGKCLDLQSTASNTRLVQRTCTTVATQLFTLITAGDGTHVMYTVNGRSVEVEGASPNNDAFLAQGPDATWANHRLFFLKPVLAAEPHRLKFSHASDDGPCGDYYWYDITRPNGQLLGSPGDSFVQLIFAGGKVTAGGRDENPFIAQQVSGNQVAIDPLGYMNGGSTATSGSCLSADLLYDVTRTAPGKCCIRYNGATGVFRASSWSTLTFLCQ